MVCPPVPRRMRTSNSADVVESENQPGVGSDENERFANVLDALEHDTFGEVRIAHREHESTRQWWT